MSDPSPSPRSMTVSSYWDARYTLTPTATSSSSEEPLPPTHDCYFIPTSPLLQAFLVTHLPPSTASPRILHLGTGNSLLPISLLNQGYADQTAVDFSSVVIAAMRKRHPGDGIRWEVADVRDLTSLFVDGEFDIAVDKGALDLIADSASPLDPPEEVRESVRQYVDEISRVLKPGGKWLCIGYKQTHFMKPLLQREGVWKVEAESFNPSVGELEYFKFVMTKLYSTETAQESI